MEQNHSGIAFPPSAGKVGGCTLPSVRDFGGLKLPRHPATKGSSYVGGENKTAVTQKKVILGSAFSIMSL